MSHYDYDEGNALLEKANAEVQAEPDNVARWEALIKLTEESEGGLNRNSAPQHIAAARDAFSRFLAKYPLFFGYWKRYADLEFTIAGTEAAESVYERGVASISVSVDLWANHCAFKSETCHEPELVREVFERGASCVGLDFLSHPFWDKYIEFEERIGGAENPAVFALFTRIIQIPLHQYSRYFDRFQRLTTSLTTDALLPPDLYQQYYQMATQDPRIQGASPHDFDLLLRANIEQYHLGLNRRTQEETTKRWKYESEIKRPYFNVVELEEAELANWHKYLDFEESLGNTERTKFLYERCLAITAQYDDFWQRYANYTFAQGDKTQDCRYIYARAACLFTPIARTELRFQWALFEESCGEVSTAHDILEAMLMTTPDSLDVILALVSLAQRQEGHETAIRVCDDYMASSECSASTKGALIAVAAKLAWQVDGDAEQGRAIFRMHQSGNLDNYTFWSGYLDYELDQPTNVADQDEQTARIKAVHDSMRQITGMDPVHVRGLSQRYLDSLASRGGKTAAKEYMELNAAVNGSTLVRQLLVKGQASQMGVDKGQWNKTPRQQPGTNGHKSHAGTDSAMG